METTTYTPEQIAADFEDLPLTDVNLKSVYATTVDLLDDTMCAIFLATIVKIDGAILRANINDEELLANGRYIANLLISLPEGTNDEFVRQTGLELISSNFED